MCWRKSQQSKPDVRRIIRDISRSTRHTRTTSFIPYLHVQVGLLFKKKTPHKAEKKLSQDCTHWDDLTWPSYSTNCSLYGQSHIKTKLTSKRLSRELKCMETTFLKLLQKLKSLFSSLTPLSLAGLTEKIRSDNSLLKYTWHVNYRTFGGKSCFRYFYPHIYVVSL